MSVRELLEKVVKEDSELSHVEIIRGNERHTFSLQTFADKYPEYLNNTVKKFNFRTYEGYIDDVKYSCKVIEIEVE